MLVLNRRPGESVIIEPDVHVTVLSVADRRVRISFAAPNLPTLFVSAAVTSASDARLEIGPLSEVSFEAGRVRIEVWAHASPAHGAQHDAQAGADPDTQPALAINRAVGERVDVGDDVWVGVASVSKGNPCIAFGGTAVGEEVRITLIRPAGSYVRLGVEAPNRRVYREELWAAMLAAGALDERVGRFEHGADGTGRNGHDAGHALGAFPGRAAGAEPHGTVGAPAPVRPEEPAAGAPAG